MSHNSLKTILSTFTDKNGKKLILFNAKPVGGISSKVIILLFLAMPVIEYFAIFNDYVYNKVGFVTQIVMYIVFMSIMMMVIFAIIYATKKSVIKKITPDWNRYFDDIDLAMVLSVGITPYSDFFKHYMQLVKQNLSDEVLHEKLKESFKKMQDENSDLLIAIRKDKLRI
ncbi:MAG: hypothetical protein Q9M34_07940 [Sulfurimonas sp.]|nr:hypothetical protein [Sulfurimonas sp.]